VRAAITSWESDNQWLVTKEAAESITQQFSGEKEASLIREHIDDRQHTSWLSEQYFASLVRAYLYDLRDQVITNGKVNPDVHPGFGARFLDNPPAVPVKEIGIKDVRLVHTFLIFWFRANADLGWIDLTSSPPELYVFADGESKKLTNQTLKMSAGDHVVTIGTDPAGKTFHCPLYIHVLPGPLGKYDCDVRK
jgi:hypothetical protein